MGIGEESDFLLAALVKFLMDETIKTKGPVVTLQKYGEDGGFTDLKIQSEAAFHLFIEAKTPL
jgi:hypothetical protein